MKFALPRDEAGSQVRVTARSDSWNYVTTLDNSFKDVEIALPEGVDADDVEAFADFINAAGQPTAAGSVVLKTKVRKPAPATTPLGPTPVAVPQAAALKQSVEPKVETAPEPKPEPIPEPKVEAPAEAVEEPKESFTPDLSVGDHLTKADETKHQ